MPVHGSVALSLHESADCAVAAKVQVTFAEPAFVAVIVTVLPFVAPLTERVGVLSDVMLSELEEPVSEPVSTSGVPGAAGKYVKPPVSVEA